MGTKKLFLGDPTPTQIKELLQKLETESYFTNLNKAANYLNWVYNYSLVLMCGVFEAFLLDALKEIVSDSQHQVAKIIISDFLKKFEESSITKKLQEYNRILGINQKDFFDFSLFTKEIQNKLKNFRQQELQELYRKRNSAAHTDCAIISKNELELASETFQKLIINLVSKLHRKHGLITQMTEMARGANPFNTSKKIA